MARYWCKFCSVFVTDTKFERNVHENSGKHKSAVRQSLRSIHQQSRDEKRESEEVAREMARIEAAVTQSGHKLDSAASTAKSDSSAAAPPTRRGVYERVDEVKKPEVKAVVLDANTGTGQWEKVEVVPLAAPPVNDFTPSEFKLSAAKKAQRVNDSESVRWKIQEKQLDDDDDLVLKKRKLDVSTTGNIKLELNSNVKEEVKEETKESGSMFKRKKKKTKS